jgi:hypothetical protein
VTQLVRVSFPRTAAAPSAIRPLPRARKGAAVVATAIPALTVAVVGVALRALRGGHAAAPVDDDEAPVLAELTAVEGLVYELLDAHADTVRLASELEDDPTWGAHNDYLRALQREGRALLSQLVADTAAVS